MANATHQPPRILKALHALLSPLGFGRGMLNRRTSHEQPRQLLELYSFEGCPACRRVRRTLTELDLDFVHRSSPMGSDRNRSKLAKRGGRVRFPYLVDPNTGVEMYESREIVRYLEQQYGEADVSCVSALPAPR